MKGNTDHSRLGRCLKAGTAVCLATAALSATTQPEQARAITASTPNQTASDINRAVIAAGQPGATTPNGYAVIPDKATNGVQIRTPDGKTITMSLPATGEASRVGTTTMFDGAKQDNTVAVQELTQGVRALIDITGPDAPERYTFRFTGGIERLVPQVDGTVLIVGAGGAVLGEIEAPWARDANGQAIPTRYDITADGTTLVQTVEHKDRGYAYPVVADPMTKWYPGHILAVRFSAMETGTIAGGGASAAIAAGALVGGPVGTAIGFIAGGVIGAWGTTAVALHKCLRIKLLEISVPSPIAFLKKNLKVKTYTPVDFKVVKCLA